jgi:hypothetical protein
VRRSARHTICANATSAILAAGLLLGLAAAGAPAAAQPAPPGTWTLKAPRPEITNEAAAVTIAGRMIAPGGSRDGNSLTRNDEYDPATDRWRALAPLPAPLDHLAVAVAGGKLYAFGGFIGTIHRGSSDSALEYDPVADRWRLLAPLKGPRGAASAAELGGKLHVLGGRLRDHELLNRHDVYDPATGTWSEAAPLPLARDHFAVVAVDGRIHAIGGRMASPDENTGRHDVYDPATNAWSEAPSLPTPRSAMAAVLYRGMILLAGGEVRSGTFRENEAYDLKIGKWLTLAPLPEGRHGHGGTVIGDSVYMVGGALKPGGGGVTDQLLMFTLP